MKKQISVRMKKTLLERIDRFAESRQERRLSKCCCNLFCRNKMSRRRS